MMAVTQETRPARGGGVRGPQEQEAPPRQGPAAEAWVLVERTQAGDMDAFGELYARYVDVVFRFVYGRVGNRDLAEDLTADTFVRALARIGSVTWQGRAPVAWLITIARNLVADHFKSGRYRFEVLCVEPRDTDTLVGVAPVEPYADVPYACTEAYLRDLELVSGLERLRAAHRECLVLRFLVGFSLAETARVMGTGVDSVKALQYRATRALAQLLPADFMEAYR